MLPASAIREFVEEALDPKVRGFLHLPTTPNGNALVLTHGAGSNAQALLLIALAETFCAAGFTVLRCYLPYRQARSYGPPGPGDAARDRAGLKNAVAAIKKTISDDQGPPPLAGFTRKPALRLPKGGDLGRTETNAVAPPLPRFVREGAKFPPRDQNESSATRKIFLAGYSYGGRQSSMLCAEEPDLVAGLLLLSYPLHPPRRPEQQRTQHLPSLRTSALFVHGTRDPFGSIAEIERALKTIPAPTKLLAIEGAGHDLGFKAKVKQQDLPGQIFSVFQAFMNQSAPESTF
jgi:hypothetical protein